MERPQSLQTLPRWRDIGAGLGYFGVYLGVQILVSISYTLIISIRVMLEQGIQDVGTLLLAIDLRIRESALGLTSLVNAVTLGVFALIFFLRKKNPLGEVRLVPATVRSLLPLVPLGLALNVFVSSLLSLLPPQWLETYQAASSMALGSGMDLFTLLMIALLAPFTEEVLFRGLVYTRFSRALPRWLAIALSALLFGLMHGQPVWVAYTAFLGVALCLAMDRYGSLWGAVALHMAFNAGSLLVALLGQVHLPLLLLGSGLACWALTAYIRLHVPGNGAGGQPVP